MLQQNAAGFSRANWRRPKLRRMSQSETRYQWRSSVDTSLRHADFRKFISSMNTARAWGFWFGFQNFHMLMRRSKNAFLDLHRFRSFLQCNWRRLMLNMEMDSDESLRDCGDGGLCCPKLCHMSFKAFWCPKARIFRTRREKLKWTCFYFLDSEWFHVRYIFECKNYPCLPGTMQPFRPDLCTLEWHGGTRMVLCVFCRNFMVCLLILRIGTRPMVGKKCARTQKWSWMDLVQTDFQRLTNASGKPEMRLEIKFSSETWHLLASFGYRCSSCKDAKIPCRKCREPMLHHLPST